MNAIARQKSFGNKTQNAPIGHQGDAIEQRILVKHRQANRNDHSHRLGQQLHQRRPRPLMRIGGMKRILAAIASDTQLGKAQERNARRPRLLKRGANVRDVMAPVERRLIQYCSGNRNKIHIKRVSE